MTRKMKNLNLDMVIVDKRREKANESEVMNAGGRARRPGRPAGIKNFRIIHLLPIVF